jgi:hypothetical protein
MSTHQKKRQHSRADVDWPVFLLTPNCIVKGETRNISPGGAFIHALTDPVLDDIFRLIIKPPAYAGHLVVTAEVAWKSKQKRFKHMVPGGMGVQFTQISRDDRDFLNSLFPCYI